MSSARNAGEIAFLDFEVQPSAEIVRGVRGMQVKLRFWISKCNPLRRSCVSSARNAGEIRACRVRRMQVKLRFRIAKCNPLRRSSVSIARNAGKVAISDFIQRSCTRGPTTGS